MNMKRLLFCSCCVSAFNNYDSSGTHLAWRGWTFGNRPSVYDEELPLPPISSLTKTDFFGLQRPDGTRPFESDLDDRIGFSGRVRFPVPERGLIQITHLANRAHPVRHVGGYS